MTNDTCASAARLARAGQNPKISYHFYLRLPPYPPPQGGTFERREIFGFAAAASLLQKDL
ncbi:MAG: hypothetical protein HY001_02555 [Candidatus Portnoybacteria bacterium]|nr:hypothetical protein [Candidatus Portnoybacteria bacterium]